MALIATATKTMPEKSRIGGNLILTDDGVEVINGDFWVKYNPDTGPKPRDRKNLERQMKAAINRYKSRKAAFDDPQYTSAIATIQSNLEV